MTKNTKLRMSLFDRLIDGDDDNDAASRVVSRTSGSLALRQSIQRDLSWLFNATNNAWTLPLARYPELATSVVNFGVRSYAGLSGAGAINAQLEQSLTAAILAFEPRIIAESLRVQVLPDSPHMTYRNHIALAIHGELYTQATTEIIYLKTEFDLDSGEVSMVDISEARQFGGDNPTQRRSANAASPTDFVVHDIAPSSAKSGGNR